MRFFEAYFGGIFNMVIGTGIILGAIAVIADYINAKMKVKELQSELKKCQRELYDSQHPTASKLQAEEGNAHD
jgi:uncharacterized membrane protein YciS (DUF1049 family)